MLCLIVSKTVVIARQMFFAFSFLIWQMLLPRIRWYPLLFWQILLPMNVADILPLQCSATIGRLMLMPVADGIATCCLFVYMFYGQMLLPCGRWNSHFLYIVMADVIAQWQMEWPLQGGSGSPLVDVVPRGQMDVGIYFSLSSEVLCRTSSHI